MKVKTIKFKEILSYPRFWYFAFFSGLYVVYLSLTYHFENVSQVGISALFGLAVASLLQSRHHQLIIKADLLSKVIGIFFIALFLWYGFKQAEGPFLRLLPLLSGLGVGLLASGFNGLRQYIRELTILFFLGVPSVLASFFLDISPLTAKATAILLLYLGFDVQRQGVDVLLPGGSISVVYDCSGIDQMNYLLGLSVLCLVMFPLTGWAKQLSVPLFGLTMGFISNVIRVAMMAIFAALNKEAFQYWHTGEGSYVFALLAVFALGLLYKFLLQQEEKIEHQIE